jgi:OmcA/MtrC family decaheme c-type cytochrome
MLMHSLGVVLLSAVAAGSAPSHPPISQVRQPLRSKPVALYSAHQMEAYLSTEDVAYVRPGFNITLVSFQIPADRRPVAEVKFTDDMNQPLDRLGQVTPGVISASFILSWYDATNRDYVSYTKRTQTSTITGKAAVQASADSGGAWTEVALGTYRYRFGTTLPADFSQTKTTTLGIYGSRNLTAIIGKNYYKNLLNDFRPDGGAVTEKWDAVATATCNNCHDPLALHGGSRQEVKLCVLCHNKTQSTDPDTGNTVEMRSMVHKIHNGPALANGYTIIGFGNAVHDYSRITYPQDVRNCTTCHVASSPEGHIWYANPSRTACGSCHDSINWETGENHVAGPMADDAACKFCHQPQGETEFDASIKGAHTIPTKSEQLAGLELEILSVTGASPGAKPSVLYGLTNGDGSPVAPSSLASLNFHLGGPTADYANYVTENCRTTSVASGNSWICNFATNAIPADATGTWTISGDYYRNVTLDPPPPSGSATIREAGQNPVFHFAVTDAQAVARRAVVDLNKCNKCHNLLALHGGQRYVIGECVICHNPNKTDAARRPADQGPAESVHFKRMIHRIHTGEELTQDLTIYGFGNTPHNYNEVLYPGDRRNCESCHVAGSYDVPVPDGSLPTVTLRDYYTPQQPAAAACLGCHDTIDAAAHAYVNNAPFAEACASCHGEGRDFAVSKVHAR